MTGNDGAGRPLWLIHGWGSGRAVWQPFDGPLAAHGRLTTLDLPGYGNCPDDGCDFLQTAQTLAEALPDGCVLGGWPLGALLAMQVALLVPSRLAGLILIGASPCFVQRNDWATGQAAALLDSFDARLSAEPAATLRRFIALFNQGDERARSITRQLTAQTASRPPALTALRRGLQWLREIDLRQRLAEIDVPTLLIHGEHDLLNPLAAAQHLAFALPQSRLAVVAGAAHAPFWSNPSLCSQWIADFRDHPAHR
ncbi:MAG TPA: alpha/beta fold hydrolase [Accumulibacter sp.]|nr:alpha/beta fold hydrolase [Accumulibacter sp.]